MSRTRAVISTARGRAAARRGTGRDGDCSWLWSTRAAARRRGWGTACAVTLRANSSGARKRVENSPEIPRLGLVWGMTLPWHPPPAHRCLPSGLQGQGIPPPCKPGSPSVTAPAPGAASWMWELLCETPGEGLILPHTTSHTGSAPCISHLCFPPLLAVIQAPGESLG